MQNKQFFEKQGMLSMQCGMHSINNLLQQRAYRKEQMEAICNELSQQFINPHKHVLGGDYDANVIILALQRKNLQVQWLDRRKQFNIPKEEKKKTMGFLVNIAKPKKFYHNMMGFSARHWTVFRLSQEDQNFTYCDSQQENYKKMNYSEMVQFVRGVLQNEGEVFWVYKQQK